VRWPGIVTLVLGIVNFALALILALFSGWGYYGVAAAGAIVLTLKNAIFTPWYATVVLGIRSHAFTRAISIGVVAGLLIAITSAVLAFFLPLASVIPLGITGGLIAIIYLIVIWKTGLSKDEKDLFGSYIPEKIRKFFL
jgi:membrane protein EpsK